MLRRSAHDPRVHLTPDPWPAVLAHQLGQVQVRLVVA